MLIDNILNGLGTTSSRSGSSAPRSGGTASTNTTTTIPLTPEEKKATHGGGHYTSSGGEVERWYIDENTGRKYYTVGDKAGTWVQVQEPRQQQASAQQSNVSTSFDFAPYVSSFGGDTNNKAIRVYVGSKPNVIAITASSRSGNYSDVARQALTSFLTSYNQAQIDAEIAANGIEKPRQTSGRSGAGSYSKTDAQIQYDNLSSQVAQMLFQNALAANKVVTLQDVLASANPETRSFYVPEGFWYIGDQPSATTNTGAGYGNGYGTGNGTGNGNTEDDTNTMIWLLLPILAMFGAKMLKNNKQTNSRKRR